MIESITAILMYNQITYSLIPHYVDAVADFKGHFPEEKNMNYFLDEVDCEGGEDSLLDCKHYGGNSITCDDGERAKVICKGV